MINKIINAPAKVLALTLNFLFALPLIILGLTIRMFCEWLYNPEALNAKPQPEPTEPTQEEFLEALEYLATEMQKQEAEIEKLAQEEEWDIEVELEEEYEDSLNGKNKNIH